jgi:hypothetical protein
MYGSPPVAFDMDGDGSADENISNFDDPEAVLEGFRTPAEWGELYAYGVDIVPGTTYIVWGDCGSPGTPGLSDPTTATTCVFGDVTTGVEDNMWLSCLEPGHPDQPAFPVSILDVLGVLQRFAGNPDSPAMYQADLFGGPATEVAECLPDQAAKIIPDVVWALSAFSGMTYTNSTTTQSRPAGCPTPCP